MSVLRHLATGTDGSTTGIGGCPFDMDTLQRDYIDGTITPTRVVNFGPDGDANALKTDINMAVDNASSIKNCDGKQVLDVLACSGYFETTTMNFRMTNLHKPGAARASDVWVAVPTNKVIPQLIKKLHQGALPEINIYTLHFINKEGANGGNDKPRVVQNFKFKDCFIKCVDMNSYGYLSVFSFSYTRLIIAQLDFKQITASGEHAASGSFVYKFDYKNTEGAMCGPSDDFA